MPKFNELDMDPEDGPSTLTEAQEAFLERADAMLDDDRYHFAWDTLQKMRNWVANAGTPTPHMEQVLDNIVEGHRRHQESARRWGRRYEGR